MSRLATYVIEPRISRFQVQAFAGGLLSALGHNPIFAIRGLVGDMSFREETLEEASLIIRVDASSLRLMDDISERDRREIERNMHLDVLETSRFPEIMFATSRVDVLDRNAPYLVDLDGNLTLHGQTRAAVIPARVSINGGLLRAFGEFRLWQSDYHIQLVSIGGGTLKIKDELKLTFDIGARLLREASEEEGG
ncbi:MAG TPA: YceI family protein [Bryobacteraceae bacterium]|jgi:polyisoprenoid-binding protein YceI